MAPSEPSRSGPTSSSSARSGARAAAAAVTPVALFVAALAHPSIPGRLPNAEAIASAVIADPTRWGLAHLAHGVASAVVVLAFLAVRSYLRDAGEERWSRPALVFVVLGSAFYTMLPGMEFAPLAAVEIGADVVGAQEALTPWFLPVLIAGAVLFAIGAFGFATAVSRTAVLSSTTTRVVAGAFVVMAVSRFVPLAAVQFHVQALASLVAFWPLAWVMWQRPEVAPVRTRGGVARAI